MQSIRKRLSIILAACAAASILVTAFFVNMAINSTFTKYMSDIQAKREERITSYFSEVYKKEGRWTAESGAEIMHEAYMDNYCLTLRDKDKNLVWTMDPNEVRMQNHFKILDSSGRGAYLTKTYEIKIGDMVVGYVDIGQYSPILLTEDDANFKNAVNNSVMISAVMAIIITIIVSLIISKKFSEPIVKVSNTSVQLSEGSLNARSDTKSSILEIKNLVDSINTLGEKLAEQDALRKRLVSDISHEIRTPLNILQNNLEAMVDGIFPVTTERLVSLNDEVIRFGKLLDNLNILKEFESETAAIKSVPIDLDKLMGTVIKDFAPALQSKGIELKYTASGSDFVIMGDNDKLKQVFINILSNAVKFSNPKGNIWVDMNSGSEQIIVKIRDNGIGINSKDLPFIFERLYRSDKSRHMVEGNGIGLTIVKAILTRLSASIDVESQVGKGTTFTITFNKKDNHS